MPHLGLKRRTARAYLASRARLGVKFGLDTMRALVEALDHPESRYPSLLVAGTNGKGSVAAYVDACLRAAGLRVGRYTSPHLVRINERIAVDGRDIDDEGLEVGVGQVRQAAGALVRAGRIPAHPTHFEVLTAAAFDHFRREAVDVAVLEVGMGGRLDATNVAEPLASAIVTVDRDHEAYLGSALDAIAREKAGVLRPGRPGVVGPVPAEAQAAVEEVAAHTGAVLVKAYDGVSVARTAGGIRVVTPAAAYDGLNPLPGRHQEDNLVVALRLLEVAREQGIAADLGRVPVGIARTRWPGRLQRIPGAPPLFLDGAHNPAAARALAEHVAELGPLVLVFGAMADKHVAEMARILFPLARRGLVLTRPPLPRAARPEEIAALAGELAEGAVLEQHPGAALARARRLAGSDTPILVAGSLYLVGEVLRRVQGVPKSN